MEASKDRTRDAALGPYLSMLERLSEHRAEGTRDSTIHVGERTVDVEPWERAHLLGALDEQGEADDLAWRRVLADGVAFRTRCLVDLDGVGDDAESGNAETERLLVDVALGLRLMEEAQQAINLLVLGGKLEDAKNLTRFRHKIKRTLDDLKGRVGEDATRRAEAMAPEMAPDMAPKVAPKVAPDRAEREVGREPVRQAERRPVAGPPEDPEPGFVPQAPERKRRALMPILLVILVLCGGALAGLEFGWIDPGLLPPWEKQVEPLTLADLTRFPQLTAVDGTALSLFAEMPYAQWRSMKPNGRTAMAEDLARVVKEAGYTGMLLRAETGKPLADWIPETGVRILDDPRAAAAD
jgi:hypothetical protein